MQRDKKNIDAAQMQGQIAGAVIATSQKAGHLEGLVRQQKCGKQPAYVPAPGRRAFSVQKNAHGCKQGGARQPRKMQGAEMGKAKPLRDGFNRIEKILHWFPLCQALCTGPSFSALLYGCFPQPASRIFRLCRPNRLRTAHPPPARRAGG